MDFVLDIVSLLNYWQEFVVVMTVQEYQALRYIIHFFLMSGAPTGDTVYSF